MDSQLVRDAVDLLATLDQEQRNDLSVHLYSAHLLKHLLYRANKDEKKILRTETFVKTVLKEDWTAWPSENVIIDPNTTSLYEYQSVTETQNTRSESGLEPGQLDQKSLNHATEMLYGELNAFWQQKLKESFNNGKERDEKEQQDAEEEGEGTEEETEGNKEKFNGYAGTVLDINQMDLPDDIFQNTLFKLDQFIGTLHLDAAEKNTISLSTVPNEPQIKLTKEELGSVQTQSLKGKAKYDYKDIIVHACASGEDMSQEYLKAVELFQDLPKTLDKSQFVLPDSFLNKFTHINLGTFDDSQGSSDDSNSNNTGMKHKKKKKTKNSKQIQEEEEKTDEPEKESEVESFVELKRIFGDRRNDPNARREARLLLRKDEFARDKKMFFTVLEHQKKGYSSTLKRKPKKKLNTYGDALDIDTDYGFADLD